jgi:hypothetical protein
MVRPKIIENLLRISFTNKALSKVMSQILLNLASIDNKSKNIEGVNVLKEALFTKCLE